MPLEFEDGPFQEIGGILGPLPETGDKTAMISATPLKTGARRHGNAEKFVDPFAVSFIYLSADTGQALVRLLAATRQETSIRVTDGDGDEYTLAGLVADLTQKERTTNSLKGESFTFRPRAAAWVRT